MLDVRIDSSKEKLGYVRAVGDTDTLIAEVATVVGTVYANMCQADAEEAREFRGTLLALLADPGSPVWDVQKALGIRFVKIDETELRKQMEAET